MASYESEHATDRPRSPNAPPPRRPDLSTFFSTLSQITPSTSSRTRPHAVPVPHDISAAHLNLAEAFTSMRSSADSDSNTSTLLASLITSLNNLAEDPPLEVEGVSEEYIADLERVPIKKVPKSADCPICGNPFREDPHPLLVRLPCHPTHVFDLECVRPWLLLRGTCPLDRANLGQRERDRKKRLEEEIKKNAKPEDDEEEWDGLYG